MAVTTDDRRINKTRWSGVRPVEFTGLSADGNSFLALKADFHKRMIQGYCATWTPDEVNDKIVPGAFSKSLEDRHINPMQQFGRSDIRGLWQHDPNTPIARTDTAKEDGIGLWVQGYVSQTSKGEDALELLYDRAIDRMSIGYHVKSSHPENGLTYLDEVDIWEWSIVTFPANMAARVQDVVKSMYPVGIAFKNVNCGMVLPTHISSMVLGDEVDGNSGDDVEKSRPEDKSGMRSPHPNSPKLTRDEEKADTPDIAPTPEADRYHQALHVHQQMAVKGNVKGVAKAAVEVAGAYSKATSADRRWAEEKHKDDNAGEIHPDTKKLIARLNNTNLTYRQPKPTEKGGPGSGPHAGGGGSRTPAEHVEHLRNAIDAHRESLNAFRNHAESRADVTQAHSNMVNAHAAAVIGTSDHHESSEVAGLGKTVAKLTASHQEALRAGGMETHPDDHKPYATEDVIGGGQGRRVASPWKSKKPLFEVKSDGSIVPVLEIDRNGEIVLKRLA